MKKLIVGLLFIGSLPAFAQDCVDLPAYANNGGVLSYCVGAKVIVDASYDRGENEYIDGVIVEVSQTPGRDSFETYNNTDIKILTTNGKKIVSYGLGVFFKEGCQEYLMNDGWASEVKCVGDSVVQRRGYYPGVGSSSRKIGPTEVVAIGLGTVLTRVNGEIVKAYGLVVN